MRRGSFLGIREPFLVSGNLWGSGHWWKECGRGMRIRREWVSTFRSPAWSERMEVFSVTLLVLSRGPPSPAPRPTPRPGGDPQAISPVIGGTGQTLGGVGGHYSRTTLRLCFPGHTEEGSPISGLPWIHGGTSSSPWGHGQGWQASSIQEAQEPGHGNRPLSEKLWSLIKSGYSKRSLELSLGLELSLNF